MRCSVLWHPESQSHTLSMEAVSSSLLASQTTRRHNTKTDRCTNLKSYNPYIEVFTYRMFCIQASNTSSDHRNSFRIIYKMMIGTAVWWHVSLLCAEFLVIFSASIMWMTVWELMISNYIMSAFHLVHKQNTVTSVLLTMKRKFSLHVGCKTVQIIMISHADFNSNHLSDFHYSWRKFMPVKRYPSVAYFNFPKSGTKPPKLSGYFIYHQVTIQQFYVLLIQCIYVLCVDLRTNSDYFPTQN